MRVRGRLAACAALGLIVGVIAFSSTGVAAREEPRRLRVTKARTTPRLDRLALRDRQQRTALPLNVTSALARIRPSIEGGEGGEVLVFDLPA